MEECKVRNVVYESVCVLCNVEMLERKKLSKWEEFKNMAGVYVGETARSVYERAGEHWQDVKADKLESHMLKHWHTDHAQETGQPKFKIRIVKTCTDALSRQISESVRIDLRGSNVINSKTEYSRCRIPRLTIDREGWKSAKDAEAKDRKKGDMTARQTEDEIRMEEERISAWQRDQESSRSKRKVTEVGQK